MHFCIAVITDEFPTDDVIGKVLEPYYEETFFSKFGYDREEIPEDIERPLFMWDWWQVGGRYGGLLKLKCDIESDEYRWPFYAKQPRAGRLFRSAMLETMGKEAKDRTFDYPEDKYRNYLGYRDGYILVDGCKISDCIDFVKTVTEHGYAFVDKDGTAFCRSPWNGTTFIDDEQYEDKVRSAAEKLTDGYICYVDIHD